MSGYTLSDGTRAVLEDARREAERLGAGAIGAEHVVIALLAAEPKAGATLQRLGLEPAAALERLAAVGSRRARAAGTADTVGGDLPLTSHAKRLLEVASRLARVGEGALTPAHLIIAAVSEPRGALARLLGDAGIDPGTAAAELGHALGIAVPGAADRADAPPTAAAAPAPPPRDSAARPERRRTPREAPKEPAPRRRERTERTTPERPPEPAPESTLEPRRPLPHLERAAARRRARLDWKYVLLLAVPVSLVLAYLRADPVIVFVAACAAIVPLAGLMGEATEQLAHQTGPTLGGLLNATFGNAAELIIAIAALRAGQIELVKASITGSILGNLLLILGLSLVAASLHRPEVRFNRTAAGMSAAMMALAVIGLGFPAIFHATHPAAGLRTELWMSEAVAAILVLTYGASLLFSLRTHRRLFGGEPHPLEGVPWGRARSVVVLALATAFVAWESEILVHAVEPMTEALGLSPIFLGLIVIPIVGNAAEHSAAVMVARKGQTDLALQIALGSSTQVALLVAPVLVAAGVVFGQTAMNLVFTPFEIAALGVSTVVISIITLDGESHWFEGLQLLAVYAMIAVAAFFV